jgi:predicted transcriptional regulator YheO
LENIVYNLLLLFKNKSQLEITIDFIRKCNKALTLKPLVKNSQNSFNMLKLYKFGCFKLKTNIIKVKFDLELSSVVVYRYGEVLFVSTKKLEVQEIHKECLNRLYETN